MKFQASAQGLQTIDTARQQKGWTKTAPIWWANAAVSETTLKRFWRGKAIRADNFKAICAAIGITNWESIVDWSATSSPSQDHPYIERPPIEQRCYQEILRPGALIRIKAPPKMGKTWLMNRIFQQATTHGYHTVPLNLLQADTATRQNLDRFLRWFCESISRRLQLDHPVTPVWSSSSSANDNCTDYFERHILSQIQAPLILGLENVDRLFPNPAIATDFLGLLRSWYEDATILAPWQKLRLILVHSTAPYIQLNAHQSPFNVGLPIDLPEFSPAQVQALLQHHHLHYKSADIDQLMQMLGGHPYLLQQAIDTLVNQPTMTLPQLLTIAPTPEGPYRHHLRHLRQTLQQNPALTTTLSKVVSAATPIRIDFDQGFQLHSTGLIRWCGNTATPFCQLYRDYFSDRLTDAA